jgi:hypothetical protein
MATLSISIRFIGWGVLWVRFTGIAGITPVDGIIIKLIACSDFDNSDN